MMMKQINKPMMEKQQQQQQQAKNNEQKKTKESQYLAPLVYTCLTEKRLKTILREIGLSTSGKKRLLIKRHREYIIQYNAEQDQLVKDRKTKQQIVREVNAATKVPLKKASSITNFFNGQLKDDNHEKCYQKLIERAKENQSKHHHNNQITK
mmetsp:Transcript_2229/g.3193  ORF Transcript_2229/g.3193 Transcript_2229/m.3193 type:complete len:152 (-) Transcript_2229:837-1292(-)